MAWRHCSRAKQAGRVELDDDSDDAHDLQVLVVACERALHRCEQAVERCKLAARACKPRECEAYMVDARHAQLDAGLRADLAEQIARRADA